MSTLSTRRMFKRSARLVAPVGLVVCAMPAWSAVTTWAPVNSNFNDGANWTAGAPGALDTATFTGPAGSIQPNVTTGAVITGIDFSSTVTSGYQLTSSGPALTITGADVVRSALTQAGANTVSAALVLGGAANSIQRIVVGGGAGSSLVIDGNISDNGNNIGLNIVRINSSWTLTLAGNNTFGGGVNLGDATGRLNINSATALGTGALTLASSTATFDNTSGNAITLTNNNNLKLSVGTGTFSGTNNLSFGTGTMDLLSGGAKTLNTDGTATLSIAAITENTAGTGLTRGGTGTLLLGNGYWTGGTTNSGGNFVISGTLATSSLTNSQLAAVLQLRNSQALAGAAFNHNTGTLQLRSDTDNALFATASYSASGAGVATINVDQLSSGSNLTLRLGDINATAAATQTIAVTGGNGYGLRVGTITQTSVTASTLTINNTAPLTVAGLVTNSTVSPKFLFSGAGAATVTGNILQNGSAALVLEKSNAAGSLVLQGTSNMTGAVLVTSGTIQTAVATNAFGSTSGISIGGNGILALRTDTATAFGNGSNAYNLSTSGSGATVNLDRVTAGAGVSVTLGTLLLPGSHTFNVTGGSGMSLVLGAVSASSASQKVITNNLTVGGGTLSIASYAETDPNPHTITFNGGGTTNVEGAITQNGANALGVTYSGTGRLILKGTNTNTGGYTVTGGVMQFNSAAAVGGTGQKITATTPGIVTTGPGYAIDQGFLDRVVTTSTGALALSADNANALNFNTFTALTLGTLGDFTYSGTILPSAITSGAYRFGGGSGNLTVASQLTVTAATVTISGGPRVIFTGANSYTGATTLNNNAILQGNDTTATRSGDGVSVASVFGTSSSLNAGGTNTAVTLELRANGEANSTVQNLLFAVGQQASAAGVNYTIDVNRSSGVGTNKILSLTAANMSVPNTPSLTVTSVLNVTGGNGYNLRLRNATALTLGGATSSGGLLLNPTTANLFIDGLVSNTGSGNAVKTLILGGTSNANRITGTISDNTSTVASTALIKSGTSTWTLSGNNISTTAYSGGTTVQDGTLFINNTTGSGTGTGAVNINGGRLGGTGRITGATTVGANGTLLAGDGVNATENLELNGALTLGDGSTLSFVLGTGNTHSTLTRTGSGTWAFDGGQAVSVITNGTITTGTYEDIVTGLAGTALAGDPSVLSGWTITTAGMAGTFSYDNVNNSIDLNLSTVPEPTSVGLLLLGSAGLLARRRRHGQIR